jgi:hypothetical protein
MSDFSKYTRQQLIDLCRTNKVKGFSHKSIDELIGLLVNAGIKPAEDSTSAIATTTTNTTTAIASAATTTAPETTTTATATATATNKETEKPRQYIFYTGWNQVLPYIEEDSAKLVIADVPSSQDHQWIVESVRIMGTGGTLLIRGFQGELPAIQHSLHASWITVGSEKILILHKEPYTGSHKTMASLYNHMIEKTDGTILLPFASESIGKLLRNHSFIAMDDNEARVSQLYSLVR